MPRRLAVYLAAALLAASVLYVGGRALRNGAGNDASVFYFAARLLARAENPYDLTVLRAEWEKTRLAGNPRPEPSPFVNPPIVSVLVAPAAPFPVSTGLYVLGLLNLACLFGSVFLLDRLFLVGSSPVTRLLVATWVILMPPVMKVLSYGQSALLVCAPAALALYFLRRRRDLWAAFFLALSFAKFTITLPLLGVLLLRGRFKAAVASVAIFGALNLALILPLGLGYFLDSYKTAIAAVDGVNGMNDPFSPLSLETHNIVSSKRFFILLLGLDRAKVTLAMWVFAALAGAASVLLLRKRATQDEALEDPLELALAIMLGMALMYHRVYDLAALMFVVYPLVRYRRENPAFYPKLQLVTLGTAFALSFFVVGTGWSKPFDFVLTKLHLPSSPHFGSVFVVVLLVELIVMTALDRARLTSASPLRAARQGE